MKYILVCGGGISSVGKGVVASSIGKLLKTAGYCTTVVKIDPYLNYNAGSLRPTDHGEVFVLDDGSEVDLDLGNYERFLDVSLSKLNSITSGRMYEDVIRQGREGFYNGKTVQVIPHLTDHIQMSLEKAAFSPLTPSNTAPVICIIELGGVVGDIESYAFVESLRRLRVKAGAGSFTTVGVEYVPLVGQECKTKPTQSSIRKARELGIPYDIIVCRSGCAVSEESISKIAAFSDTNFIINVANCDVHTVPQLLKDRQILKYINERLMLCSDEDGPSPLDFPDSLLLSFPGSPAGSRTTICIISKYAANNDSYASIKESLRHAGHSCSAEVLVEWVDTDWLIGENAPGWDKVKRCDGVVIPGGFGHRGAEEMLRVIRYCREEGVPIIGICLGFQLMVVEHCRNVLGMDGCTSEEFHREQVAEGRAQGGGMPVFPVVDGKMGMKLGLHGVELTRGSRLHGMYSGLGENAEPLIIKERFRHRYAVDARVISLLNGSGLAPVGTCIDTGHLAGVENTGHPCFVGVQYHPEFLSRPGRPSYLFKGFVEKSVELAKMGVKKAAAGPYNK